MRRARPDEFGPALPTVEPPGEDGFDCSGTREFSDFDLHSECVGDVEIDWDLVAEDDVLLEHFVAVDQQGGSGGRARTRRVVHADESVEALVSGAEVEFFGSRAVRAAVATDDVGVGVPEHNSSVFEVAHPSVQQRRLERGGGPLRRARPDEFGPALPTVEPPGEDGFDCSGTREFSDFDLHSECVGDVEIDWDLVAEDDVLLEHFVAVDQQGGSGGRARTRRVVHADESVEALVSGAEVEFFGSRAVRAAVATDDVGVGVPEHDSSVFEVAHPSVQQRRLERIAAGRDVAGGVEDEVGCC